MKAAIDAFGRVDLLVNNAGILRDADLPQDDRWEDWDLVIKVHLYGSFNVKPRSWPKHFRKQESGTFVHMTSTSGLVENAGQANYSAAKMGIISILKSLRSRHGALQCPLQLHFAFPGGAALVGSIPERSRCQEKRLPNPEDAHAGQDRHAGDRPQRARTPRR